MHRATAIMLLGTHSNAGKSLMATAFCRLLARQGYRVAPFKAQNMSNNAGVTPEGGEMGRAQIVQAEAAGIAPHTDMNPVLLKPEADRRSQVVLNGRRYGHIEARNWLDIKRLLWDEVCAAYDRLARRFDVLVMEGAGSPAEINLKDGDIVNLRMARYAGAPCLLVGDIDRGGVFAALAGTLLLLDPAERAQIRGFLINKFRGDPALLGDATTVLEQRAFGVPTLGLVPFIPGLSIADEDAVALEQPSSTQPAGEDAIDIAVIHLPHIANFDEFGLLAAEPGVHVRYVNRVETLGRPHVVILPGTKVTIADLRWLEKCGLAAAIRAAHRAGAEVVGICGGYQMLGMQLADPLGVEGPPGQVVAGLSLLPVTTVFSPDKQTYRATLRLDDGQLADGYEIHAGETTRLADGMVLGELIARNGAAVRIPEGARTADSSVWGCYLHGIFENDGFRHRWLEKLQPQRRVRASSAQRDADYDRLADVVEAHVNWAEILRIAGLAS
ncbi:MAG: cobyric acid synthase [Caldilineaceae bacterium]|nr:cobyric acid synthase [Caldilineaceae bacterium]